MQLLALAARTWVHYDIATDAPGAPSIACQARRPPRAAHREAGLAALSARSGAVGSRHHQASDPGPEPSRRAPKTA
jgi:hypothetical protein